MTTRVGNEVLAEPDGASKREWLLTDGLGGFAMGTVAGLRTRRYHGLLLVAGSTPGQRHLGLAALDPVLHLPDGDARLGNHRFVDGTLVNLGQRCLAAVRVEPGSVAFQWLVGGVTLELELSMERGRRAIGAILRVHDAPGPVSVGLEALCTWRDAHGARAGDPDPPEGRSPIELAAEATGFSFEGAYRVIGPGFRPVERWWRGVAYTEEAARGLEATEDLFLAGSFTATLRPGDELGVVAAAADRAGGRARSAGEIAAAARHRAASLTGPASDEIDATLRVAADAFILADNAVVAGYPFFGEWSRDTLVAYEGLFCSTGRTEEGRVLLERLAAALEGGLAVNTTDSGGSQYNTIDAALWFLHAVDRHVAATGDLELGARLVPAMRGVIEGYRAGPGYGIGVDAADGLVFGGVAGVALTWMDARVDGVAVTPRIGKPVEVNALWVNGLAATARLAQRCGVSSGEVARLEETARRGFRERFPMPTQGCYDVLDGPTGHDASLRPNQLFAVALPHGPFASPIGRFIVTACRPLLTPLGLRSLGPNEPGYQKEHTGGPAARDRAYHQGTVWPYLIGAYVAAALRAGVPRAHLVSLLAGLEAHLGEWGIGSVSETAFADPPHRATGCPFQAWSVAELIRARQMLAPFRGP